MSGLLYCYCYCYSNVSGDRQSTYVPLTVHIPNNAGRRRWRARPLQRLEGRIRITVPRVQLERASSPPLPPSLAKLAKLAKLAAGGVAESLTLPPRAGRSHASALACLFPAEDET
jgi:hypothetical protein